MKHFIIFLIFTTFCLGCKNNKSLKDNSQLAIHNDSVTELEINIFPIIIDKEKNYENKNFFPLREVGNVEYIKLETNENCLIPNKLLFQGICLDEDNIFISTHEQILRFDKKGKFINSIGKIGQGPKEILFLSDFKINERSKEVLILDQMSKRILFYNYNGLFQKSILLEKYCSRFDIVENDIILCFNYLIVNHDQPIIFSISSISGKTLSDIVLGRKERTGSKGLLTDYYTRNKVYNNKYINNTYLTDTIFCVDKETLKVEPRYIQIPPNTGIGEGNSTPFLLFETNKYANILIYDGGSDVKEKHFIINKKTNEIYKGIFADYEKGTAVIPINTNKDNILADLYEVPGLKKLLSKGHLTGSLKEITESLDEEDNPILVIVTSN